MKPNQADRDLALRILGMKGDDWSREKHTAIVAEYRASAFRAGMELARAEAARVAGEQARLNAGARRDRADDELAFEFEGLGNVISAAILAIDLDALGEKE
jgi:hypothetical protein